MDTTTQTLPNLFAQLGLDNDAAAIESFIKTHRLPPETELSKAPFWSAGQASFLKEAWRDDSDWCEIIDELNALLH